MTGPYSPQVAGMIRSGAFRTGWSIDVRNETDGIDVPLSVTEADVTMDEFWSPYVQGSFTAAIPPDQALLDALDPRKRVRVTITAGYWLPNGTIDEYPIAVTYLNSRSVDRPSNTIQMTVQGKEYLHDGWVPLFPGAGWVRGASTPTWNSDTEARDAVTRCLLAAGAITGSDVPVWDGSDPSWDYDGALRSQGWANNADPWTPSEESALDVARDIADRCNGWFRCDEVGIWRFNGRPFLAGDTSSHQLAVGSAGTIETSQTGLSRDGWANAVRVYYSWSGGESTGYAYASDGPYAISAVGQMTHVGSFPFKATAPTAQARAAAILRRYLSRGRSMSLDATPAYWLRAGHTVTVQLPLGPQERHLVSAVTFTLHTGSMRVRTRVPDTTTTIIGG